MLVGIVASDISPDYLDGTTGTATQGATTVVLNGGSVSADGGRDFFLRSLDYDASLTGSWVITLQNETDTQTYTTAELVDPDLPDTVTNVKLSFTDPTDTTSPTITWDNPWASDPASAPNSLTIDLFDLTRLRGGSGGADNIAEIEIDATATSFTFDADSLGFALDPDTYYTVAVQSNFTFPTGTLAGSIDVSGSTYAFSRNFVEFTTSSLPIGEPVFLPVTDLSGPVPIFNFDNDVVAGEVEYYDPLVAIGYDYAIGAGDPFFNSFILPDLGDGSYELWLWDDSELEYMFKTLVSANTEYLFDSGGVDRFRILGIETGLGLDPEDPTAFVTGLSFVADGRFTGTMTPITVEVDDTNIIPLPGALPLMAAGLGMMGAFGMRRRRRK